VAKTTFTDITIRSLAPPPKGQKTYWDGALAGFGIRLSQGGARTWVLLDPRAKVRTQQTIGRYPILGLKAARDEAKRLLAERTLGKHRPKPVAWNAALDLYLGELKKRRRASTHAHYTRFLRKYFRFGETKLGEIETEELSRRLDKLADRPGEHQTAFVILRAFLRWCQRQRYLDFNPLDPLRAPHKYKPRKRVLNHSELKAVWHAAGALGRYGQLVRFLILTGQRRGEAAALDRSMHAGETITLPDWLAKNHRDHTFPIGPMTQAVLAARQTEPLYFPAFGTTDTPMSGWSKMKKRLDKGSKVADWTLHDLRRTLRTNWAALGIPKEIAKRYINHAVYASGDMDEVYDQHTYLPEMAAAVAKYEAWLQALVGSEIGNKS
jgi:integrase